MSGRVVCCVRETSVCMCERARSNVWGEMFIQCYSCFTSLSDFYFTWYAVGAGAPISFFQRHICFFFSILCQSAELAKNSASANVTPFLLPLPPLVLEQYKFSKSQGLIQVVKVNGGRRRKRERREREREIFQYMNYA